MDIPKIIKMLSGPLWQGPPRCADLAMRPCGGGRRALHLASENSTARPNLIFSLVAVRTFGVRSAGHPKHPEQIEGMQGGSFSPHA